MEHTRTTHGSHLESARYEHDCSVCEYKGRYKKYDLYFCNGGDTLIARYGDNGWDYLSKSAEELQYEMEKENQ